MEGLIKVSERGVRIKHDVFYYNKYVSWHVRNNYVCVFVSTCNARAFLPICCWELSATIFLDISHGSIPDIVVNVQLQSANPVEEEANKMGDKKRWVWRKMLYIFSRNNDTVKKSLENNIFLYHTQYWGNGERSYYRAISFIVLQFQNAVD